MVSKSYYVTTPIYYVNAHPHIGSAYTTVLADTLNRFYRFLGYDTFFLTGTDEHGDKIQQAAEQAKRSPLEFATEVSEVFKRTWAEMGLEYSRFIRTTEAQHQKVVRDILSRIYDKGDIYFGEYEGNYCVGCERFLTEKELVDGKCPDHGTPPRHVVEKNYFFRMSRYQEQLLRHITETQPDFIRPEGYRHEVVAMLREPLEDLCISRPKTRLQWGIELPFDANYVTYVWFDALINYLTGVDYPDGEKFNRYWPVCEHLIGKDILKPHAIFWPTMLLAADIPLYRHLNVHGFWVTPTGKMSKSRGNVIDPMAIKREYGMDTFRYYVLREMTFGVDGIFSLENLETRYNADLANNLGNLVSRSLAMVHQYRGGVIPTPGPDSELERDLIQNAAACVAEVEQFIKAMEIHRALERIWSLIDVANIYIDRTKPWALAKQKGPESEIRLNTSLYSQLELIRIVSLLITGFLPETSAKILAALQQANPTADHRVENAVWGKLVPGAAVLKISSLFPRREKPASRPDKSAAAERSEDLISIEEFGRVELCVGQILSSERIAKSEKLLKLGVDVGEEGGPRQIIAGIGKHYDPEKLIGRKVVVVKNLKPAKLMGQESRGMLLAASDNASSLELLSPGNALPPGTQIR